MTDNTGAKFDVLTLSEAELVDTACDRFETAWRGGDYPCLEGYLDAVPESCRATLLVELIKLEIELRAEAGEVPTAEEYRLRFPDHGPIIQETFHAIRKLARGRSTSLDERIAPSGSEQSASEAISSTTGQEAWWANDPSEADGFISRNLGDYLILDRIGSGGQGVVYRALEQKAGRYVAIKVIKADWLGDATFASTRDAKTRFRNEAQNHSILDHDHIVPIYHVGEMSGMLYLVMRLIKGISLSEIVKKEGPLPPRRAAYYLEAIARAIQHAHNRGLLHRDVKPGNILIESERPYLIDLGLAKCLEATDYTSVSGKAKGTAAYMSPEQARGQSDLTNSADVYGLGSTLFTLLTGRPLFAGDNPIVVLRQVIDDEPVWPREFNKPVGPELKAICLKCLEKSPVDRFATADELADELRRYLNYEPCKTKPPKPLLRLKKWAKRQPWRAAAASLAIIVGVVIVSAMAWNARRDRQTAESFLRDLPTIPLAELPRKIKEHGDKRNLIKPVLHERLATAEDNSELHTRYLLALLPSEPDRAQVLADRLLTCETDEHKAICEMLKDQWAQIAPKMRHVLGDSQSAPSRRIRAAAALIALETSEQPEASAWSELRLVDDPAPRVELLEWLVRTKIDPQVLASRLEIEPDTSVRRQLIQTLGALGDGQAPAGASLGLPERFIAMYRTDPDAGIHSSLAYLLRRWGMGAVVKKADDLLKGTARENRNWYVNSVGLTMVIINIPVGDTQLPSRESDVVTLLAVATIETPMALMLHSDAGYGPMRRSLYPKEEPLVVPAAPADAVSYFDAARFCNWLSEQEKIPPDQWCFVPGEASGVLVLAPDFQKRRGYRLPTLAEWEFAARAGTTTNCYFGNGSPYIDRYTWHYQNSPRSGSGERYPASGGQLRPNEFGLFDIIGNLSEWCFNPTSSPNPVCECRAGKQGGRCEMQTQSLKGGAFAWIPKRQGVRVLAGYYDNLPPNTRYQPNGFRVVKNEF